MAGINRNKECNEVSVMMRFKVDSRGQAVNNRYRKQLISSIRSLFMMSWIRRPRVGLNRERTMKIYLGNISNCPIP